MGDTTNIRQTGDQQALIDYLKTTREAQVVDLKRGDAKQVHAVCVPEDFELKSIKELLDEYLQFPERRKGRAQFQVLASLIAFANRFKDSDSVLFANKSESQPMLAALIDYHKAGDAATNGDNGGARWCEHIGVYSFPVSDEWQAWQRVTGQWLKQEQFAQFLEERIGDISDPAHAMDSGRLWAQQQSVDFATPARLMELARGLSIHTEGTFESATNLSTGEGLLNWSEEYKDKGGNALRVPAAFLLAIPVFAPARRDESMGDRYQIPVRLRFRKAGPSVIWQFAPARMREIFDFAFTEACDKAQADTGLPLFFGTAEV